MVKVRLNKRGVDLYPWLAETELPIYGFIPHNYSFVIWDYINHEWLHVNQNFCEGVLSVIC